MTSRLEAEFQEHLVVIDKLKLNLNKHLRIRVEQWIKKLKQKVSLDVWKKNRNTHALLLSKCLESNKLVSPFNKMPVEGSLPQLKQHEINEQLNIIKHQNYGVACHAKFIKEVRQRSEARQKISLQSKNSDKIIPAFKKTLNFNNYSSQIEKITKETSINGSQIHEIRNSNPSIFEKLVDFVKKYQHHYKHDPEYNKLISEINKHATANELTPMNQTTFRGDDTQLKVVDPSEYEIDKSYFATSRSQEKQEEEQQQ